MKLHRQRHEPPAGDDWTSLEIEPYLKAICADVDASFSRVLSIVE